MKKSMQSIVSILAIVSFAVTSQATMITLTNADFETNPSPDNAWSNADPASWTATNAGLQDDDLTVGVIQTVVFLQGGSSLIQEFSSDAALGGTIAIGDTFGFSIFAHNTNASPTVGFDIQNTGGASLIGGFQDTAITLDFTTVMVSGTVDTASTTAFLHIRQNGGSAASSQALLDNVSLEYTTIPELSSTALLGLGALALILRRRK